MATPRGTWPDPVLLFIFLLGSLVMRSAGCVINDIFDRKIDKKVKRTKNRPLASGQIKLRDALWLVYGLLIIGLILLLQLNDTTIYLGFFSVLPIVLYPLMKRWIAWPQLFLGFTFNMGAILGWSAVRGSIELPALLIYIAAVCWTFGYDTIYGHQDKRDDKKIGVKSSSLALGKHTQVVVFSSYAFTIVLMTAAGLLTGLKWPFFVLIMGIWALLAWQAVRVNTDSPAECAVAFRQNRLIGFLFLLAIICGKYLI